MTSHLERASVADEARLRAQHLGRRGVAYAGRDFRIYPHMRIGEAARFYASIHATWDSAQLEADLVRANLDERFEVRRLKRAYQRALVLALVAATKPALIVVEGADEFDDDRTGAFLLQALGRAPAAIATYPEIVVREPE